MLIGTVGYPQEERSGDLIMVNIYREIGIGDPDLHRVVKIPLLIHDDKVFPNESFRDNINDCLDAMSSQKEDSLRGRIDYAIKYELISLWMKNDTLYDLYNYAVFPGSEIMYLSAMKVSSRYFMLECNHGINYPLLTDTRNIVIAVSNVFAQSTIVGRPDFVPEWFFKWLEKNSHELEWYFGNFANYYQFSGI